MEEENGYSCIKLYLVMMSCLEIEDLDKNKLEPCSYIEIKLIWHATLFLAVRFPHLSFIYLVLASS